MGITNTYVRARIDSRTKELATDALEAMGLTVSVCHTFAYDTYCRGTAPSIQCKST